MEVLKENFEQVVESILIDIDKSDFISFDLELTGINNRGNQILDFPEERYLKYKQTAEKYRIIQIGLSIFRATSQDTYECKPYKFYVFPEENSGNLYINCETSALLFNAKQIDFNKWIGHGVPYVNAVFDKKMLDSIMEGNVNLYNPDDKNQFRPIFIKREEDRIKCEEFTKIIHSFLASDQKSVSCEKYPRFIMTFVLNQLSSEHRKKIYFEYDNSDEEKSHLVITKMDYSEKIKHLELYKKERLHQINQRRGFRRIFERLTHKRAYIVGHNMIHDVLFLISHFGDPLPNTVKEFKSLLRIYFSGIMDTKHIFESFSESLKIDISEKSNLGNVYQLLKAQLNNKINITFPEGFIDFNNAVDSYHDAGFDAFVTGACFAFLKGLIGQKIFDQSNKIHLMRSIYKCYDLLGDDPLLNPAEKIYCLKANMNRNDIDLEKILDGGMYSKIKKIYPSDYNNSVILFVDLNSFELIEEFESKMFKFKHLFQTYNIHQFKEYYSLEENNKKKKY